MQIIFKGVCPKCKQDIGLNTDTERKLPELKKMEDYVFEIMKEQSIKAAEKYSKGQIPGPVDQGGFFNDIFNLVEELGGKCPTKPIQYIRNYFHNLKTRIRFTKDKKELQRLKKKITNMKIDVSKNTKKEFEKGKRDALKLLKEADKKFNKKSKR